MEESSAANRLVSVFNKLIKTARAEVIGKLIEISDNEEMETILNELNKLLTATDYEMFDIKTKIEVVEEDVSIEESIEENNEEIVELLECTYRECDFQSCKTDVLKKHIYKVHENPSSYSCDECDFMSLKIDYIRLHKKMVHGERDRVKCHYDGCDYSAKWKGGVNQHIRRVHEGVRFPCDQCDFVGLENRHLKYHIKKSHQVSQIFSCSLCDYKTTSDEKYLKIHVNSKHRGILFACDQCDYKAPTNKELKRHKNGKHLGILHDCPHCDFKASFKTNLKKHIERLHLRDNEGKPQRKPKVFICNICDHRVSWKGSLTRHMLLAHGTETTKFSCDKCDYEGNRADNLKAHKKAVHAT